MGNPAAEPEVTHVLDGDTARFTLSGELTDAARRPLVRVLTDLLLEHGTRCARGPRRPRCHVHELRRHGRAGAAAADGPARAGSRSRCSTRRRPCSGRCSSAASGAASPRSTPPDDGWCRAAARRRRLLAWPGAAQPRPQPRPRSGRPAAEPGGARPPAPGGLAHAAAPRARRAWRPSSGLFVLWPTASRPRAAGGRGRPAAGHHLSRGHGRLGGAADVRRRDRRRAQLRHRRRGDPRRRGRGRLPAGRAPADVVAKGVRGGRHAGAHPRRRRRGRRRLRVLRLRARDADRRPGDRVRRRRRAGRPAARAGVPGRAGVRLLHPASSSCCPRCCRRIPRRW